ncbi:solute carrier family 41 member 1 isoform X1 [Anabrus simplex]|uniref:solute carrier family 41 member 1 isoform X1 n=1 Tax=Anabrus simplex TaxID=316456 RepID=UPI0034DD7199
MVAYPDEMENNNPVFSVSNHFTALTLHPSASVEEKKVPVIPQTPGGFSLASHDSLATLTSVSSEPDLHVMAKPETSCTIAFQVAVPFFLAGLGTIGAGLVLGRVQHWVVFQEVSALFILVPALLGLKGNLDMCLASRLSTLANLGKMDSWKEIWTMVLGNLALVQIQATVAAIIVSIFAVAVASITEGSFNFNDAILLSASSITTATSSCFTLDLVMIAVIIFSQRYKLNPDNVATPLAASIGDVVSITLLANISSAFFTIHDTQSWISILIIALYLALLPLWIFVVFRNKYTRPVLTSGWIPVLSALLISGLGGLVLDSAVDRFKDFVVFQPIINGIGGNLVSVQASRISTMLHQTSLIGIIPPHTKMWASPWSALITGLPHAQTARILILLSVTGQTVFIFVADYIHSEKVTLSAEFVASYLVASSLQIMLLLYLAHLFIHAMWRRKMDPDNSAIPFLTSIGDLVGSGFLAVAFIFLQSINRPYEG